MRRTLGERRRFFAIEAPAFAGNVTMSSAAPSAIVPRVTASKQKESEPGSTWPSVPTSTRTMRTLAKPRRRDSSWMMSTMPSVSDISCIGVVPYSHVERDAGNE